jgi:hypothetical protein
MKRFVSILLVVLMFAILTSCNSMKTASLKNVIAPAELSSEQQDIVNMFATPNNLELMIFNYNTEDMYSRFEVWVEIYQDGKIIDRPAGIEVYNDNVEKYNGRLATIIIQNNSSYQWMFSLIANGSKTSHITAYDMPFNFDAGFGRAFGSMSGAESIEDGKEIIIYFSAFMDINVTYNTSFDTQTLQERPELLNEYPYVQLIKCKFSK